MKCLFVAPALPHPPDSGGRVRTFELLRALAPAVEIHLRAVARAGADSARDAAAVAALSGVVKSVELFARSSPGPWRTLTTPRVERWFCSSGLREALWRELVPSKYDLVHLDEMFLARALPSQCSTPAVIHHHKLDLEYFADLPGPRGFRQAFDLMKLERLERFAARRSPHHVVTSQEDARRLSHRRPALAPAVVESGFDPLRFHPDTAENARRHADEILFLGSLDYGPNLDGLAWWIREVLPLVRNARPGLRLSVVGSRPGPAARALCDEAQTSAPDSVRLEADVLDVVPHLRRAALLVIPLRIGGGTRLKLVEAAATGTPVVSTQVGAEGLAFRGEEHLGLADSAPDFAREVLDVLARPAAAAQRALRARQRALERYTWSALAPKLLSAWERAAAG